jgi:hypothetical protein
MAIWLVKAVSPLARKEVDDMTDTPKDAPPGGSQWPLILVVALTAGAYAPTPRPGWSYWGTVAVYAAGTLVFGLVVASFSSLLTRAWRYRRR